MSDSNCQYCGRLDGECAQRPCPPARQNQIHMLAIELAKSGFGEWPEGPDRTP